MATVEEERARQAQEAELAKAREEEDARAAAAAKDQTGADAGEEVVEAPGYRPFDPYVDIDTNCNMGTAHGAPVGPMTQGCGPIGRLPFGNRANLRPLNTGDVNAMYTEPTIERDPVAVSTESATANSDYQKAQLEKSQQQANEVMRKNSKPVKTR